ncbi:MAG: twin-arginine translocase subunit TatC, partial [Anaerolineales bacterium]
MATRQETLSHGAETDAAPAAMSLWEHLEELRGRLLRGLIALGLTTTLSFAFGERLIAVLARPIGGVDKLVSIEVTENIGVFMRVSLLA